MNVPHKRIHYPLSHRTKKSMKLPQNYSFLLYIFWRIKVEWSKSELNQAKLGLDTFYFGWVPYRMVWWETWGKVFFFATVTFHTTIETICKQINKYGSFSAKRLCIIYNSTCFLPCSEKREFWYSRFNKRKW